MSALRVLLSAYQCAPAGGSVSQIGWEWFTRLSVRGPVTLVTHARNRTAILAGGEFKALPETQISVFMLRTKAHGKELSAWWPQVRFPSGRYAFAFAI